MPIFSTEPNQTEPKRISTFCAQSFNSIYSMNWRFDIILFHLKWHPFDRTLALIFCMLSACVIRISLVPFTTTFWSLCFPFLAISLSLFVSPPFRFAYHFVGQRNRLHNNSLALATIKTGHCVSINSWLKYRFCVCVHVSVSIFGKIPSTTSWHYANRLFM